MVVVGVYAAGKIFRKVMPVVHSTELGKKIISGLIDLTASRRAYPDYRINFKSCVIDQMVKHSKSPHSHYLAATDRCRGNMFIKVFSSMIGSKLYSVSMSNSESETTTGDHYYYNAKDLQMKCKYNIPLDGDLIQMTDVDYYVDLNAYMNGRNIILNTFVPTTTSGSVQDGVFCIEDDQVKVNVNGGAFYQHQLWNYETDHIIADHWWGSCLYLVEQREIAPMKRLVFLNCVRVLYGPLPWLLEGYRLKRRKFCYGDIVHLRKIVGEGMDTKMVHHISQIGAHSGIEISDSSVRASLLRMSLAKNPMVSDVERILRANDEKDPVYGAPLLYKLIMSGEKFSTDSINSIGVGQPDMGYQTLYPLVHEDGKTSHREILPPIFIGATSPLRSYNNDYACVNGRVKNVENKVKTYTPFIWMCLDEFVGFQIPDDMANTLAPYDFDYMKEKFKRPSQRSFLQSVQHILYLDSPWIVKAFQKAEFYGKFTAPRNISTLPMDHNVRLGQYSYAFVENILKQQDWYMFGRHPREIEREIQDMCVNEEYIIPMDISKCDGSRGYIHYCLDVALMMRAFGREHHAEILRLLKKEAYAKGVTKHDFKYECDYNTLSGSSKTSWGNTETNAFNNYVALRYTMNPEQAWKRLGKYGGDDGLSRGVEPKLLESTFAKLGMLLKAEVKKAGDYLPFLGRLYLDPWSTPESIIDVPRQLSKLHATVSPSYVPDNVVLWRKVEGYLVNDERTPIISAWCTMIRRLFPAPTPQLRDKYENVTKNDVNWWSRQGTFTLLNNIPLALDVLSKHMGIDVTEIIEFEKKIYSVIDVQQIKGLMIGQEPKLEIDCVNDGLIKQGDCKNHQQQVSNMRNNKPDPKVKYQVKNIPVFNKAPVGDRKSKLKHEIVKEQYCRFSQRGEKCPYGKSCKFKHLT
jgi:hypothetical protein